MIKDEIRSRLKEAQSALDALKEALINDDSDLDYKLRIDFDKLLKNGEKQISDYYIQVTIALHP